MKLIDSCGFNKTKKNLTVDIMALCKVMPLDFTCEVFFVDSFDSVPDALLCGSVLDDDLHMQLYLILSDDITDDDVISNRDYAMNIHRFFHAYRHLIQMNGLACGMVSDMMAASILFHEGNPSVRRAVLPYDLREIDAEKWAFDYAYDYYRDVMELEHQDAFECARYGLLSGDVMHYMNPDGLDLPEDFTIDGIHMLFSAMKHESVSAHLDYVVNPADAIGVAVASHPSVTSCLEKDNNLRRIQMFGAVVLCCINPEYKSKLNHPFVKNAGWSGCFGTMFADGDFFRDDSGL